MSAYRAFIADFSDNLPKWGLEARDVDLTPAELGIVLDEFCDGHWVVDALTTDTGASDEDACDVIAVRCRIADPVQAALGCGLAAFTAIRNYAIAQVLRDVNALRDEESMPAHVERAHA